MGYYNFSARFFLAGDVLNNRRLAGDQSQAPFAARPLAVFLLSLARPIAH
jgi:hypothetical protein